MLSMAALLKLGYFFSWRLSGWIPRLLMVLWIFCFDAHRSSWSLWHRPFSCFSFAWISIRFWGDLARLPSELGSFGSGALSLIGFSASKGTGKNFDPWFHRLLVLAKEELGSFFMLSPHPLSNCN
jgi:hypothetical protein